MGQNKALMPFNGKPLVQSVADRLAPAADELFVTARRPELYDFLGLPVYADDVPDRGPLGGLLTALRRASQPLLGVVACDMPFASAALLRLQAETLSASQADIAVPESDLGLEPLHAVYRVAACLPAVEQAVAAGEWKLSGWFGRVQVHILRRDVWGAYDLDGMVFMNLNTPEDFRKAEEWGNRRARGTK